MAVAKTPASEAHAYSAEGEQARVRQCCAADRQPVAAPASMVCPVNGARSNLVTMLTVRSLVRHLPMGMPHTQ
jgi:hypothetical protein